MDSVAVEMPGYVPPVADLAPFRAGTVWHYRNVGYLVVGCSFGERVDQHATRTVVGAPVLVRVRQAGRVEVRLRLERADWADPLPTTRTLDGYDQLPGPCVLFVEPGACWQVSEFNAVALASAVVPAWYRPDDPPCLLEVAFFRRPDLDTA